MPAHLEETILHSYRLSPESLRNLDAIVRERCKDIDPGADLEYEIKRADQMRYTTQDLEDILKERNGSETGIRSLGVRVIETPGLRFELKFGESVDISAQGDDRAKFLVLISDVRNLIRESMQGRKPFIDWRYQILIAIAVPVLFVLGYSLFTPDDASDKSWDVYRAESDQYIYEREQLQAVLNREVSARATRAEQIAAAGSADQKLTFLVEVYGNDKVAQVNAEINALQSPRYVGQPLFPRKFFVGLVGGVVSLGLTVGLLRLFLRRPETIFMIGEAVARDARNEKRRERIIWGVLVAFAIGILSSLVATFVTG